MHLAHSLRSGEHANGKSQYEIEIVESRSGGGGNCQAGPPRPAIIRSDVESNVLRRVPVCCFNVFLVLSLSIVDIQFSIARTHTLGCIVHAYVFELHVYIRARAGAQRPVRGTP